RQFSEATAAVNHSLALDAKSVAALTTAARIEEAAGNLLDAANTYRKLAAVDRRSRTLYLTEVAKLEARLGRRDASLAAGRDLLAAAPGNPEHYEFFAELCFQLGESEEGLETLRRSLRANASDPQVLLTLAKALAERFRTDEAIALYWRAFEKAAELEAKLDVVSRLAELYLQTNQFDRLLERLERLRREAMESRELSICVAQAYHAAGDYGTAGQELARLLSQNPSDTQLLQQLSTLLEAEGDLGEAAKYQQQLVHLAPSREAETRLAMLLVRAGQSDEASAIWQRLTEKEEDPDKVFKAIDSLIASGKTDIALAITERMLREQPNNWEALYREVVALAAGKQPEAATRCQAILALRLGDDEPSAAVKAFKSREARKPAAGSARQLSPYSQNPPVQNRLQASYQIRNATGLEVQRYSMSQQRAWMPDDFGQARMAALAWLLALADKDNQQEAFLAEQRTALERAEQSKNAEAVARVHWDWYYLQSVRQDYPAVFAAAKSLAEDGDPMGQYVYL
ncbi:MAG: tetratricopeptide repeat protein, partial [Candidatus Saccharimonadales bacterium]